MGNMHSIQCFKHTHLQPRDLGCASAFGMLVSFTSKLFHKSWTSAARHFTAMSEAFFSLCGTPAAIATSRD